MCVILHDRYSILQLDNIMQILRILNKANKHHCMVKIRDTLLRSLKDNPDILKKLEMEESDDRTKALLKMILEQIQADPEYAGVNH